MKKKKILFSSALSMAILGSSLTSPVPTDAKVTQQDLNNYNNGTAQILASAQTSSNVVKEGGRFFIQLNNGSKVAFDAKHVLAHNYATNNPTKRTHSVFVNVENFEFLNMIKRGLEMTTLQPGTNTYRISQTLLNTNATVCELLPISPNLKGKQIKLVTGFDLILVVNNPNNGTAPFLITAYPQKHINTIYKF
ncbi:hypothetical protein JDS99_30300 [Bacillus cereus group sp. N6]|uniref:hypothetical protein n=1 Tax=Bacillus cereus group sp. N6 TaxID=2794583 RepID=UPI0018F5A35A|nr:hypothetical protein [Bacillus cereus group sp. N6]MBJ8113801.1 hypothetical protein [Bacillus cereus group sp. N6]